MTLAVVSGTSPSTLLELRSAIRSCTRCDLRQTAKSPVPWSGDLNPDILIVGEAPGSEEDKLGEPFVGSAGIMLQSKLREAGLLQVATIAYANSAQCYPGRGLSPVKDQQYIDTCHSWLRAQIAAIRPRFIVSVGQVAFRTIRGRLTFPDLQLLHGKPLFWDALRKPPYPYRGTIVWPTYHPSAALRSPKYRKTLLNDLVAFKRWVDEGETWPTDCYVCGGAFEDWDQHGWGIALCEKHLARCRTEQTALPLQI